MKNPFVKRRRRRRVTPLVRSYQLSLPGAGSGALNWSADRSPDEDVRSALPTMRAKSRAEIQNGDYLAGFLLMAQRNVVGPGLTLRPLHPSTEVADQVGALWREWAARATPSGDSWWRTELLALSSLIVDGEVLAHLSMGDDGALRVRLLDAARLDHALDGRTRAGARVKLGIEVDDQGRHIAYWLRGSDSYDDGSRRTRVPADRIVYVGNAQLVGQTRGMPFATAALLRLEQLRHYEASELIAARLGNKKMGYLTTELGAEAPYQLNDDTGDADEDAAKEESPLDANRRLWAEMMTGGGGVDYGVEVTPLDPGQRFEGLDWPHPAAAFSDFVGGQLRGAAAGLGVSYHALSGDLSRVNFSAGRIGEIASRQTWLHLRQILVDGLHARVFRRWCEIASMRGDLPGLPSELCRAEWVGRGFEHIQPREEARANEASVALRIKSRSEIIRESGRDPANVFQQLADEQAQLEALGIDA